VLPPLGHLPVAIDSDGTILLGPAPLPQSLQSTADLRAMLSTAQDHVEAALERMELVSAPGVELAEAVRLHHDRLHRQAFVGCTYDICRLAAGIH
jgi:signal transduction histidine kinase